MSVLRGFFSIPMILLLVSCSESEGEHWDLSLPWSVREFHTQNAYRFAEKVAQVTEGALTISVHPGAVLGIKGPDALRALEEGIVDIAEMPGFQQVGTEPILGLESLPFLVSSHDGLADLYTGLRPAVEDAFARHNLKVIYIVPWPNQYFYTKKKIERIEDLAGLKIRTYDRLSSALVVRLGMIPVQMPSQDVVAALASGVLDATMTSTATGSAQGYWDFLDYMYPTNHTWISNIMAVNLDSWNALPTEMREAVERAARELEPDFWEVSRRDDQAKLAILKENGLILEDLSPGMKAEMRQRARPIWDEFLADNGPAAKTVVDAFLSRQAAEGRE